LDKQIASFAESTYGGDYDKLMKDIAGGKLRIISANAFKLTTEISSLTLDLNNGTYPLVGMGLEVKSTGDVSATLSGSSGLVQLAIQATGRNTVKIYPVAFDTGFSFLGYPLAKNKMEIGFTLNLTRN